MRFVLSVFLLVGFSTVALADCPMNLIAEGCQDWLGVTSYLSGAQWDISGNGVPWQAGDACPVGCYDLKAGVLVANGYSSPWEACGAAPHVYDEYQVVGVPADTPLLFKVEMWVEGSIEGEAAIDADLADVFLYVQDEAHWTTGNVSAKIELPLVHRPGEIFTLSARLQASGTGREGASHATATIHFSGLPAGAAVVSCQSYDLPVATKSSTWGALRARYR